MIKAKARAAFARGAGRDDHGFNLGAPAIADWQREWDLCAAKTWGFLLDEQLVGACPP